MQTFLNRIKEFKTYTVNSLKREREGGGVGRWGEKEERGGRRGKGGNWDNTLKDREIK